MGIVFRQSIKTTIITFIGAALGALTVFLSTKFLSKQEYGFIRNLTSQTVMASQIFLFGLHNTLSVYIHYYENNDKRKQVLITISLFLPIILIIIATIFYYIFQHQIIHLFQPQDTIYLKRYFSWLPIFTLFFTYQTLLEYYLNSQMKVALATFIREVIIRILNVGLILLFALQVINFDMFVMGVVLIYLFSICILFFFSNKLEGFGLSLNISIFNRKEYIELLHFSWYHALLSISITMLGILDTLMLAPLSKNGFQDVAIYTVAIFFVSTLQIPYKSMTNSTFPSLAQAFKNNDKQKTKDIFYRSSINMLIASVGLAMLICFNLQNVVALMKNGYEQIVPIVLILTLGVIIDIATGMNGHVLSLSKYYKSNFYMSLILVSLMIIFNLLFIPTLGIYGAAYSFTLSLTLYNISKFVFVKKYLNLSPFSASTIRVILASIPSALVGIFLPLIVNVYVDIAIRSTLILLFYIFSLLLVKPSPDLISYFNSIRKNRRLF